MIDSIYVILESKGCNKCFMIHSTSEIILLPYYLLLQHTKKVSILLSILGEIPDQVSKFPEASRNSCILSCIYAWLA